MIDATATTSTRQPTKFMAELSRAMQTAVETSRDETMARLGADAKTVVEEIHAASAVEAAELRRHADDDVAAVREWSKAEIARIREETEARIALRKTALDGEMDQHGLVVESRVQQVGATVAAFEQEMAAFFERLSTERTRPASPRWRAMPGARSGRHRRGDRRAGDRFVGSSGHPLQRRARRGEAAGPTDSETTASRDPSRLRAETAQ
jgi:hypothetical protein